MSNNYNPRQVPDEVIAPQQWIATLAADQKRITDETIRRLGPRFQPSLSHTWTRKEEDLWDDTFEQVAEDLEDQDEQDTP